MSVRRRRGVGNSEGYHPPTDDSGLQELQHALAVQVVAGHATDANDCAELLAMLGLDAHAARPRQVSPGHLR